MGLYQIKELLHNKGKNYQSEETAYGMGKKFLLAIHLTEVNIQNIQRT
jgi:hypothetical protein